MGGMEQMGGVTMEQMEQLQMQDPAAFEQMMQMMGGGMRWVISFIRNQLIYSIYPLLNTLSYQYVHILHIVIQYI